MVQRVQAENNSVGVEGYDAYFGTYSIDESQAPSRRILKDQVLRPTSVRDTC